MTFFFVYLYFLLYFDTSKNYIIQKKNDVIDCKRSFLA